MHWIVASLLSALFIGIYDLCTKHAVHNNAVLPVLFYSTLCGALVWIILMGAEALHPGLLPPALVTSPLSLVQHLQLVLKAAIVMGAWTFSYFGIKHLPLSLSAPVRATGPLWTLIGAVIILAERPTFLESFGIAVTLVSLVALSFTGQLKGVHFHRDKWVGFLIAGTLLNSVSAVYDKYLLGTAHFSVPTVQAWFSIYLWLFFLPMAMGWKRRWWPRNEFRWRWSIPLVAFALLAADYVYFSALRDPDALVSVVISLRRAGILISFAGGILIFKEGNGLKKLPAVIGILTGIVLMVWK